MQSGIKRVRRARARHKREQRFRYRYYMLMIVSVIVSGMIVGCGMAAAHAYLDRGSEVMRVELIVENCKKEILYLTEEEIQKLQCEVDKQNKYCKEIGRPENHTISKELRHVIHAYLDDMPKPMEVGS